MSKRFRVSSRLGAGLEELGVAPAAVLERAALPPALLDQPRILVTTEELFALWRAVGDVSRDPAIGLKLGERAALERYDPIVIAALCTRTFGEALDRMGRYKQLTCPEEIVIEKGRTECAVQFRWLLAAEVEPSSLIDLCFAWVLSIARMGTGVSLTPLRLELARRRAHPALFEKHFGCPVRFEADRNAIVFRAADIERVFVTHNEDLLGMIAPQLDQELSQNNLRQSFLDRARTVIKHRLAGQRPTIQAISRELRISTRTLQRRLQESGSSFQQALEDARRELARHYLVHSPLEVNETAYLLGYEDANSFVRAFHGWEGVPPAHWRETQRMKPGGNPGGVEQSA